MLTKSENMSMEAVLDVPHENICVNRVGSAVRAIGEIKREVHPDNRIPWFISSKSSDTDLVVD
eukprot:967493-Rhodomonas_salina.2